MKFDNHLQEQKYRRARKTIKDIKKFYNHLIVYLVINFLSIGRRIYKDIIYGDSFLEAFIDINNYGFFFWWGVFLILHAIKIFGLPKLFDKDWEERKIREYMNDKK